MTVSSSPSVAAELLTDHYFPGATTITPQDLRALSRQLGTSKHVSHASIGVPSTCRCQYNYPQAFLLDPIPPKRTSYALQRVSSSLLKLTCPLLVEAIDILEDEGGITHFNQQLNQDVEEGGDQNDNDTSNWMKKSFMQANEIHATSRKKILMNRFENNQEEMDKTLHSKLGERGTAYFKKAGVAGVTTSKDVKCLHAHVADTLFRGNDNAPIGAAVLDTLQVPVEGVDDCWKRCCPLSDIAALLEEKGNEKEVQKLEDLLPAPPAPRNKQRKKRAKEIARKKRRRAEEKKQETKM